MRKQLRAGQALKVADLAKPDLVQRDENVTLIYESTGLYLTIRGKALEGGTEGDVVNVLNLQSQRTVSGVVIGRRQVAISVATPRLPAATESSSSTVGSAEQAEPVSVAASNQCADVSKSRVKFNVDFQYQSYRAHRHLVDHRQHREAAVRRSIGFPRSASSRNCRRSRIRRRKPGYKPVQMPMPKPETVSYNANSLWRNGSRSFFKDQRAHQIGDLLTVTVNITDQANFANETQRSRTVTEDFGHYRLPRQQPVDRKATALPGRLLTADANSLERRQGLDTAAGNPADQHRRRRHPAAAERQSGGRGQAGDPGQFREARADRRRHRAAGRHPERQHHRFKQDRAGPHRLWRPRPDHRHAAAALRPDR